MSDLAVGILDQAPAHCNPSAVFLSADPPDPRPQAPDLRPFAGARTKGQRRRCACPRNLVHGLNARHTEYKSI